MTRKVRFWWTKFVIAVLFVYVPGARPQGGGIGSNTSAVAGLWVDGRVYPQTAAGINAATAALGGNPGTVYVPDGGGTFTDATVAITKGEVLILGTGTYTFCGLTVPDSLTDVTGTSAIYGQGIDRTIITISKSCNKDVISDPNFGRLTGGSSFYGIYHTTIADLTIDGNKANQSRGYGIRLYGRGVRIYNVHVQNAYNDGIWAEWGGTESFGATTGDDQWFVNNISTVFNGGNGFTNKVVSDLNLIGLSTYKNGVWGIETFQSIHMSQTDSYLNTSGGCHANGGGIAAAFFGTDDGCTTGSGTGLLIDSAGNVGASNLTGGTFAAVGGTAISIGSQNNIITGQCANSTTCVAFTSASANGNHISLTTYGDSTGPLIAWGTYGEDSTVLINGNGSGSMFSGTTPQGSEILIDVIGVAGNPYRQFRMNFGCVHVDGYTPCFPQSSGHILATGNSDAAGIQYTQARGCTTAATAGATCTTTINWPKVFADTNYRAWCIGSGIASGVPVNGGITAESTTTVIFQTVAMTAVAAEYGNIQCSAVHN